MAQGRGARAPFCKLLRTGGGHSEYKNSKQTKLCWPPRKRSPKRLIVLVEPKSGRGTTKNFSGVGAGRVPSLHFQIRSGATGWRRTDHQLQKPGDRTYVLSGCRGTCRRFLSAERSCLWLETGTMMTWWRWVFKKDGVVVFIRVAMAAKTGLSCMETRPLRQAGCSCDAGCRALGEFFMWSAHLVDNGMIGVNAQWQRCLPP